MQHFSTFICLGFTHAKSLYFHLDESRKILGSLKVFLLHKWTAAADLYHGACPEVPPPLCACVLGESQPFHHEEQLRQAEDLGLNNSSPPAHHH